jgi:two-component system cell cycle response regulator DivK
VQDRYGVCRSHERLAFEIVGLRFVNVLGVMSLVGFRRPQRRCGDAGPIGSDGRNGKSMPKKVMIVEDNELNMKLFRDLIEASGYETVRTRNGLEALDLARQHRPDLILMDIQLPEVSGLDVTRWLKEDDDLHKIPVIAVTAFAMKGDGNASARAAARPISPSRFRCRASSRRSNHTWATPDDCPYPRRRRHSGQC